MRRRLFNLAAAVSLVLCVATVGMWIQGYRNPAVIWGEYLRWPPDQSYSRWAFNALSFSGTLSIDMARVNLGPSYHGGFSDEFRAKHPQKVKWDIRSGAAMRGYAYPTTGFSASHSVDDPDTSARVERWTASVPVWLPTVLLLMMPALWLHRFGKLRSARRAGHCPVCGYDLRATPERCPECGTAASAVAGQGNAPVAR